MRKIIFFFLGFGCIFVFCSCFSNKNMINDTPLINVGDISSLDDESDSLHNDTPNVDDDNLNSNNEFVFSKVGCYTQGMCINNDKLFISVSNNSNSNYKVGCYDINSHMFIENNNSYNHANGMAYDRINNRVLICAMNSVSSTDKSSSDYCLFECDVDNLDIVRIIDLENIVKSVCSDSIGICGVAYNSEINKICILTRYPKRYLIILNSNYTFFSSFYIDDFNQDITYGDITCDKNYIYTCYWNYKKNELENVINIYDWLGIFQRQILVNGITHIESLDISGNYIYANFNDFSECISMKVLKFRKEASIINV